MHVPLLDPQSYDEIGGYYETTGAMSPEPRAEAAAQAIEAARQAGAVAAGYIDVRASASSLANSAGLFAHLIWIILNIEFGMNTSCYGMSCS